MWDSLEDAMDYYAQRLWEYHLGLQWMRVAVPVVLSKKQSTRVRQAVYKALRAEYPTRFPKGYRFS